LVTTAPSETAGRTAVRGIALKPPFYRNIIRQILHSKQPLFGRLGPSNWPVAWPWQRTLGG